MNGLFLVFTILTVTVTTITATPAPAKAESAWQTNQVKKEMNAPPFLIFLNLEYEPCLGTLIHKQWILTAARCFLPLLHLKIAASEEKHFQDKIGKLEPMLTFQHPNFTPSFPEHDLMLIKLKKPINLNDEVKLAALPTSTDDRIGDMCTVSGWRWTWMNSIIVHDIQKNQNVVWFSDDDCQVFLGRQVYAKIPENMFCAGSSLESALVCQEITAAPILCQNQLLGILSWSDGCVLSGNMGYYTKVSRYIDWILQVIHTK
ncbi:serine protease 58-like [Choloepus didactylus]|uniref:serine protease 58-like n=1 Tax=Choloepus didactylus TaxID=27675 RepID=UPI00189E3822|nr:serine protease 58-like [Choloepus didactylus]